MKEILYIEDQVMDTKFMIVSYYYFTDVEHKNMPRRICDYHTFEIDVLRRFIDSKRGMFLVRVEE